MTKKKQFVPRGWKGDLDPKKRWELDFPQILPGRKIYLNRLSKYAAAAAGIYHGELADTLSIVVDPFLMRDAMAIATEFSPFVTYGAPWSNRTPVLMQIAGPLETKSRGRSDGDHQVCLQFVDTGTSDGHRIFVHGGQDPRDGTRECAVITGVRYYPDSEGL
jgi:hypothetical protein